MKGKKHGRKITLCNKKPPNELSHNYFPIAVSCRGLTLKKHHEKVPENDADYTTFYGRCFTPTFCQELPCFMTNIMKKTFTFLLFGILILAIFVLSQRPAGYRQALEEKDRVYEGRIDSIRGVISHYQKRDSLLRFQIDSLTTGLKQAENTASKWKQRYDKAKRTPAPPLSDAVLDSLISAYR